MKKRLAILFLIIIILALGFLIYFSIKTDKTQECEVNSDCLTASCCHPDSCVLKDNPPNCSGIFCSQVCSGPMDCGAGYCGCVNKKCKVIKNG